MQKPHQSALEKHLLAQAIEEADLRVLLMTLVHLTGDLGWLEPPFAPVRDVNLIADPSAGFPQEIQDQLRSSALELFCKGPLRPSITDPGDALMHRMMRACLGENVPQEYAPAMREELGFVDRDIHWTTKPSESQLSDRQVLIIGAGVNGIVLGAKLGQLDIPYTIVEKNGEVGGTWLENRYPGCGVDTPNHAYSLSFGERYPWSRYFALRGEIQDYLERCADDFGVRPHILFQTKMTGAVWDEKNARWRVQVRTATGTREILTSFLVSAIGQFNLPSTPTTAGNSDFKGRAFHSAKWPDDLDLSGQHVSIIGTGASAMQIVPAIAHQVQTLTIYQRTPQWVRPISGYGERIGDGARWLLENLPYYVEWFRFTMFWRYGDGLLPFLRKDPDWPHPERALNRVNDRHRQEMTDFMHYELRDRPDLAAHCRPDYPAYGKRILLDNGWYRTLTQPHVELVTEPIDRITTDGVRTCDGRERATDILIYAIGFQMTSMASRLGICGREGLDLRAVWEDDNPTAHLGITVPGFPNFFCMLGPNTGLGHGGSTMFQSECQARYISGCIVDMVQSDISSIDVRQEVHDDYVRRVDAEHDQMIWSHPGMTTYYRNARGRVVTVMPWRLVDYWTMTRTPDLSDYRLDPVD